MEPEENFLSKLHQYGLIPKIRIAINGKSPVRYYNENGILVYLICLEIQSMEDLLIQVHIVPSIFSGKGEGESRV